MKKLFTLLLFTLLSVLTINATDYYLAGTMNGWSDSKNKFDGSSSPYTLNIDLDANTTYEFKLVRKGSSTEWRGKDNGKVTSTNNTIVITGAGGNVKLETTIAGTYNFNYNTSVASGTLTVTYPEPPAPPADPATITVTSDNELYGLVTPAEVEVNETTFATITAKPMYCCDFVTWQLGGSARLAEGNLTDASIKVKSDGTTDPGTAKAVFAPKSNTWKMTYVKTNDWSSVYAHLWNGGDGTSWTGSKLCKTDQTKLGYDVYEVMVYNHNTNVTFNCNGDACKEETTINSSTPVYYKGSWYASLDDIQRSVVVGGYSSTVGVADFNLTSSDDETYTGSVYLEKDKNYQFKVKVDGTNYSLNDLVINESISDQVLYTSNGRINLNASVAGSYNFTFVFSTKKLSVEFPEPPADPATITVTSADANQGTVSPAEVQVNATQSAQIVATPKSGYIFDTWALGGSAVLDDGYELTDATIKVKSDGTTNPGTAQASFVADPNFVTVYFANTASWSDDNVKAYLWYDDSHREADWPGTKMTKTDIVQKGYTLYKHTFSNVYTKIIFSNNGGNQSANLTVTGNEGKYFHYADNKWYDIEAYKTVNVSSEDTDKGTVSPASVSVGATTSAEITATAVDGYAFDKWTLTNASFADGYSATDRVAKIISDGTDTEGTAVASFRVAQKITLYFANSSGWADVAAYVWDADGGKPADWPGTQMAATTITQKGGYTLYKIENVDEKYINVIFNDNVQSSGNKTDNLSSEGNDGKYYYMPDKAWYNIEPFTTINVSSADTQLGSVSKSTVYVSENTSEQITATPKSGCIFTGWTLTGCTTEDELTSATITIKGDGSSAEGTAVASFEADPDAKTLYFVNSVKWDTPYIHIWTPDVHSWPGTAMTKTAETATSEEFEVWSFSFTPLASQTNCKFNCGGDACQKGNFTIDYEHPYYYPYNNTWYATLAEIPDPEYITFRYVNVNNWDYVNFHYWNGSEYSSWPGELMTKEDDKFLGFDVWTITKTKGTFSSCKFNCGDSKQTGDLTVTDGKYCYYKSGWYATLEEIVPALAGTFNEWSATANQFVFDENQVGTTTLTLEANAKPEFKVIDGAMYGNNNTMTHDNCTGWTMHQSQGNCKIQARNKGEFTFTYDLKTNTLSATYPEYTDDIDMIVTNASGETTIPMTKNPAKDKEYYKYSQVLRTGDVVTFYDHYALKSFKAASIDQSGSMTNVATITESGLEITQSIETNFYLILESGNDKVQLQHGSKILDEIAPNTFLGDIVGEEVDLKVIRPMSSAYLNTLCLPFDLDQDQLNEYFPGAVIANLSYAEVEKTASGAYKTYLRFQRVNSMEAGMPYIIQPSADITAEAITFENVTIDKDSKFQDTELVKAVGILVPTELQKDAYNYLFMGAGNKLYYPSVTGTMKAMRAYFYIKEEAPKAMLKGFTPAQLKSIPAEFSIEDPEDEVLTEAEEAVADSAKAYKILNENNEIIIIIDGKQYNLAGQPIK